MPRPYWDAGLIDRPAHQSVKLLVYSSPVHLSQFIIDILILKFDKTRCNIVHLVQSYCSSQDRTIFIF